MLTLRSNVQSLVTSWSY